MSQLTYAKTRHNALRAFAAVIGLVLIAAAKGASRVYGGPAHSQTYIVIVVILGLSGIALVALAIKRPPPPSALAGTDGIVSVNWDTEKLTICDDGVTESFRWGLVGRIDLYSGHLSDRYGNRLFVSDNLLIEFYRDGKLAAHVFAPESLNMNGRTMPEVIRELNDLHEKALLAAAA